MFIAKENGVRFAYCTLNMKVREIPFVGVSTWCPRVE